MREFEFKHHLLHQVTYDTVLKAAKRDLHKRTADWLVTVTGARVGEHLGLIADHYERAGEAGSAMTYLRRAAEAAYATASFGAALAWIERAFALISDDDPRARFEVLGLRAQVFNSTGRRVEQRADVSACVALAEEVDDDALRARAWRNEALIAVIGGDNRRALDAADRAETLGREIGNELVVVGALLERGQALIALNEFDAAQVALLAALPLAEKVERPDMVCVAMSRLNAIARDRAQFDEARTYLDGALAIARATSNRALRRRVDEQPRHARDLARPVRPRASLLRGRARHRARDRRPRAASPIRSPTSPPSRWSKATRCRVSRWPMKGSPRAGRPATCASCARSRCIPHEPARRSATSTAPSCKSTR